MSYEEILTSTPYRKEIVESTKNIKVNKIKKNNFLGDTENKLNKGKCKVKEKEKGKKRFFEGRKCSVFLIHSSIFSPTTAGYSVKYVISVLFTCS